MRPPDFIHELPHAFAGGSTARAAELRGNQAAIDRMQRDPRAGFYCMAADATLLKACGGRFDPLFTADECAGLGAVRETLFLGLDGGVPRFAVALEPSVVDVLKAREDLKVTDLRAIAVHALVAGSHLPLLAAAKALLGWHARHAFCPKCGTPTRAVQAGWRRDCPSCGSEHFPRTDPVVIMLPVKGTRCVLGRSPRFPPTMWSALAGFVEPGESIEEAARREVREEVGIACGRVNYFASQPWPFPASLMIGCHAEALSEPLVIDRSEIEDARWFERDEVAQMLTGAHPDGLTAPLPIAIAHHIMRAFAEYGAGVMEW
jgi:NAD+ diphosphatase